MISMIQNPSDAMKILYVLMDTLYHEPLELIRFPAVDFARLEAPVLVAANDAPLLSNKINVISNTTVKNVLLPVGASEGDIFVMVNQTPKDVTLKVAATDVGAIATLRPGAQTSFRFVGGNFMPY